MPAERRGVGRWHAGPRPRGQPDLPSARGSPTLAGPPSAVPRGPPRLGWALGGRCSSGVQDAGLASVLVVEVEPGGLRVHQAGQAEQLAAAQGAPWPRALGLQVGRAAARPGLGSLDGPPRRRPRQPAPGQANSPVQVAQLSGVPAHWVRAGSDLQGVLRGCRALGDACPCHPRDTLEGPSAAGPRSHLTPLRSRRAAEPGAAGSLCRSWDHESRRQPRPPMQGPGAA
jgi:hypothetical protein